MIACWMLDQLSMIRRFNSSSSSDGGANSMTSNIAPRVKKQMPGEEAVQQTTETVTQIKTVQCGTLHNRPAPLQVL